MWPFTKKLSVEELVKLADEKLKILNVNEVKYAYKKSIEDYNYIVNFMNKVAHAGCYSLVDYLPDSIPGAFIPLTKAEQIMITMSDETIKMLKDDGFIVILKRHGAADVQLPRNLSKKD